MNIQTEQARADQAQTALRERFWNPDIRMYNIETPCPDGACNTSFHYWWMAHAADVLVDGLIRTGDSYYKETLSELYEGLLARNGGAWPHNWYDDMQWMAIAWLRAYEATSEEKYKQAAIVLWEDIKTGWNDHMGGGIAWKKDQLDYKNTPANAPAIILAARLHRAFGNAEDLDWAVRLFEWQKQTLVDPDTGFVWDGINRAGDGAFDKDWEFTYCQGVYIGAAHELYKETGDPAYLREAERTADIAIRRLTDPATNVLPDEGQGDGGLFKGIFVRYATQLAIAEPMRKDRLAEVLLRNAHALWTNGRDEVRTLFGPNWNEKPGEKVELSTQICGVMMLEMASKLAGEDIRI